MRIAVNTLGCRLNFAETEELFRLLNKSNFKISNNNPEIIIVRGCSVTAKAEKETRLKINELRKKFKKSFIVATGCLPKNFYNDKADLVVFKDKEKNLLKELIKRRGSGDRNKENKKINFRTRSFIKIQDGCFRRCSYCLTSLIRGQEKSISSQAIIRKIKEKEREGFQEIIITGVNIGEWKKGENRNLVWLLKEIFKKTKIPRIRISSLWPDKINDNFLSLFKEERLCRHLHLSLQSMSQSVLSRMGRFYQVKKIEKQIKKIKKLFPDLTLTADIIAGFPGETEQEFKDNFKKLKKLRLTKIHVFRFSPRLGTRAILMKNQLGDELKRKRSGILLALSNQLSYQWRKKFLNQKREVLIERKKNNFWFGFTDNYLKIYLRSQKNLINKIITVKIIKLYQDGLLAKIN